MHIEQANEAARRRERRVQQALSDEYESGPNVYPWGTRIEGIAEQIFSRTRDDPMARILPEASPPELAKIYSTRRPFNHSR